MLERESNIIRSGERGRVGKRVVVETKGSHKRAAPGIYPAGLGLAREKKEKVLNILDYFIVEQIEENDLSSFCDFNFLFMWRWTARKANLAVFLNFRIRIRVQQSEAQIDNAACSDRKLSGAFAVGSFSPDSRHRLTFPGKLQAS
ncbi:unnamed protein product [Sphenostylis stenocarpa]|uniref:Uncharacterized protein n=1 Tax=Sphenostylis stenocarpa TaxID=92480 RepID=A0AA86VM86_9FABA|nr:unnamed protein product [Sphenostylis stenocarpa]